MTAPVITISTEVSVLAALSQMTRRRIRHLPVTDGERLIGTIRRECLDWLIVLNAQHLRSILKEWVAHYNRGRPHASLGPGIPGATPHEARQPSNGHRIPDGHRVVAVPILAGLHHEYGLESLAA